MDRFAVLVDAGYLLVQSVQILSHQQSKSRKDIAISDPAGLIAKIVEHSVEALGNRKLLRVYWYDGVSGRLSAEHEALSLLADVQFRPGTINRAGQQKGVDPRIMADLIELSSNHAISDAVLVTGDGDLVVGIDLAQRHGVRVAVLGIEDSETGVLHNQSYEVVCVADRVRRMGKLDIAPYLSYSPAAATTFTAVAAAPSQPPAEKKATPKKAAARRPTAPVKKQKGVGQPVVAQATTHLEELPAIVRRFIETANPPFEKTVVTPTGALGQALDSKLLKAATDALGRKPMPSERAELRKLFRELL